MKKKRRPKFLSRGYSATRERIKKNSRYSMSCFNCAYYYQAVGDKEEVCQNENVLEYDMIMDGHLVYCTHWKLSTPNNDQGLFGKKTGRDRLE